MSTTWDTSSIEAMEKTALDWEDRDCSKKIRDHWLEVKWISTDKDGTHQYLYKWGKNLISRQDAIEVHKTAS